ncbi:MAG: hypothetical protein WCM76_00025 [Bacteroidota bacterium]
MKTTMTKAAIGVAICLSVLRGFALPLTNSGIKIGWPIERPTPTVVNGASYDYVYPMSVLNGLPASKVFPKSFESASWSIGEGVTGYPGNPLQSKWATDYFVSYRNPATPVVCIDMEEHFFIAQFYEGAPSQYGAMVLGMNGYWYNVYSTFCGIISSQEFKCYGLPVSDTQKEKADGITYYTIKVQTDPCYGSKILTLYAFTSVIPPSMKGMVFPIGSCDGVSIFEGG